MNKEEIKDILQGMRKKNSFVIPEAYSKQIFENLGMKVPRQEIAATEEEAADQAEEIGYPVVLKVHSFEITHKSDAEPVQVSVQQMVDAGIEVIIGMKRDEVFGPTILFGLGGVWVEIMKDVSLRVSPLMERDIDEMICEIKGKRLLGSFRGSKARDLKALKTIILQVEKLALEFPEISEIDLNPVFLYEEGNGAMVVDARIIISRESLLSEGAV
jgi:acyl-CoA synthetase (NDP forming)